MILELMRCTRIPYDRRKYMHIYKNNKLSDSRETAQRSMSQFYYTSPTLCDRYVHIPQLMPALFCNIANWEMLQLAEL